MSVLAGLLTHFDTLRLFNNIVPLIEQQSLVMIEAPAPSAKSIYSSSENSSMGSKSAKF